jgi:hypothetical protein
MLWKKEIKRFSASYLRGVIRKYEALFRKPNSLSHFTFSPIGVYLSLKSSISYRHSYRLRSSSKRSASPCTDWAERRSHNSPHDDRARSATSQLQIVL